MKQWLVVIALVAVAYYWKAVSSVTETSLTYAAEHSEDVILYSTAWCGYCKQLRSHLQDEGISYHEYDIEASEEGRRQYDVLGGKGVPLVLVGQQVVHGYYPSAVSRLAKARKEKGEISL